MRLARIPKVAKWCGVLAASSRAEILSQLRA